jgi:hypothetical protein
MPTSKKSNAGNTLGTSALVLGIIAILSLLILKGMLSILIGIIGIILASVGIGQAKQNNGETGLIYAGLTVSIVGTAIALVWFFMLPAFVYPMREQMKDIESVKTINRSIKEAFKDKKITREELEEAAAELEDAGANLGEEFEDILIDLESELEDGKHKIEIYINDSNAIRLKKAAQKAVESAVEEFIIELADSVTVSIEKSE